MIYQNEEKGRRERGREGGREGGKGRERGREREIQRRKGGEEERRIVDTTADDSIRPLTLSSISVMFIT